LRGCGYRAIDPVKKQRRGRSRLGGIRVRFKVAAQGIKIRTNLTGQIAELGRFGLHRLQVGRGLRRLPLDVGQLSFDGHKSLPQLCLSPLNLRGTLSYVRSHRSHQMLAWLFTFADQGIMRMSLIPASSRDGIQSVVTVKLTDLFVQR
jgi:hypothetical protein